MAPIAGSEGGFRLRRSTAACGTHEVVERREAQRARSRRSSQGDWSVARATPEARASGNVRPRGVATTPAPPGAPLFLRTGLAFVTLALAKLGRNGAARTEERVRGASRDDCGGNALDP